MKEQIHNIEKFREADNGYNKPMKGRLQAALGGCPLTAVGGDFDGQGLKAYHLLPDLPSMPRFADPTREEAYKKALPVAFQDFLFANPDLKKEGYMARIGGFDFRNLPDMVAHLSQGNANHRYVIRVVQGATTEMPLRALSYMLPSLVLMDQLKKDGITLPQLQMISAHHISGRLDRMNLGVVAEQAEFFARVAREYVKTFFPKLTESVVFLQDTPLDKGILLRHQLMEIAKVVRDNGSTVEEALKAKGKNHGAERTYQFYAAAHLVVHDSALPILEPLIQDQSDAVVPGVIVSIGGKKEEEFYKLRHEIKPHLGPDYKKVKTLQYFTKHRVPPYYMARGGDQGLKAALYGDLTEEVAEVANHDLKYLDAVSDYRGYLSEFLEEQGRKLP